eukprot:749183-Hanusia_phi.AAC.3
MRRFHLSSTQFMASSEGQTTSPSAKVQREVKDGDLIASQTFSLTSNPGLAPSAPRLPAPSSVRLLQPAPDLVFAPFLTSIRSLLPRPSPLTSFEGSDVSRRSPRPICWAKTICRT